MEEASIAPVVLEKEGHPEHAAAKEEQAEHEQLIPLSEETEAKYQLIVGGLAEVIGANDIRTLLKDGKDLRIYWGTATTGKPHLGYFVPIYKISDYLAG